MEVDTRPILQRDRSLTTLTKFCPLMITYPPPVDNVEGISLLEICIPMTFPVPEMPLGFQTQVDKQ